RVSGQITSADGDHQGDHPDHRDDHHERHQLHEEFAGNDPGDVWRRLEVDFAAGHAWRRYSQTTYEPLGGHSNLPSETRCIMVRQPAVQSHHHGEGCTITLPLPSSLPDPDSEPESEPELNRVTVVVGELQLDVGLPADVSIAAVADDVIELANAAVA